MNSVEIKKLLLSKYGLNIAGLDDSFVGKVTEKWKLFNNVMNDEELFSLLVNSYAHALEYFHSLNNNYSEFFRNPLTFSYLEQFILPCLITEARSKNKLRIWSAGCAAGQEPYSLAIIIDNLLDSNETDSSVRIFATDISSKQIEIAQTGIYSQKDIQNVPVKYIDKYFTSENGKYKIRESLKKSVDFSVHDMLDIKTSSPPASIYGDFNMVLCCNLLFYYEMESQVKIINNLYNSLLPGGYLITGEVERNLIEKNDLFHSSIPHINLFQKHG